MKSDFKLMPLMGHLDELRSRLIKAIICILIFFIMCLAVANPILKFLQTPLMDALPEGAKTIHFTGPLDVFMANIKVAFLASVIFSAPYWIYHFWKFLEPGLYEKEKKFLLPFVISSILLFFTGILFCFFIILPLALEFLIGMGMEVGTPMITIPDYISMLSVLILGFGLIFEAPLVLILLSILDIVDSKFLSSKRRHMLVVVLIVGAILTPPDPITQIGMAIPLYLMYEISILIIRRLEKRRLKKLS